MTKDESFSEYDSIIRDFTESRIRHDNKHLCKLVEYVRGHGVLYGDFPEKNAELLELLLRISFDFISSPLIYTSSEHWWFIMEVYDIIFHQVDLSEYPSISSELYFKLTKQVLDESFHKFYKTDAKIESYGMCIYFIQMADGWFAEREIEFIAIFESMAPLIGDNPDHLEEPWINTYKKFKADKN